MKTHTPAEWKVIELGDFGPVNVTDSTGKPIAFTATPKRGRAENEANARLIAAAPELLGALEMHLTFLSSLPRGWLGKTTGDIGALNDAYLMGNKALAKVKGRS